MNVNNKRKERDLMKLVMSNYEVKLTEEGNQNDFYVSFEGPKESPYEGVKINDLNYQKYRASGKFMYNSQTNTLINRPLLGSEIKYFILTSMRVQALCA